ncbi:MAG TPA: hypothetical protein PLM79_04310 [Syntrophobacteraceae bacterium]|nr:hypothetical protein [Syntrophobacteraceae bacterium]
MAGTNRPRLSRRTRGAEKGLPSTAHSPGDWALVENSSPAFLAVRIGGDLCRVIDRESLGKDLCLLLIGARYAQTCRERAWPPPLDGLLRQEAHRSRFHILCLREDAQPGKLLPVGTLMEDSTGDRHVIEVSPHATGLLGPILLAAAAELSCRAQDPSRYDSFGDFLYPGGPNLVERHSTERLQKHLGRKVVYDALLCNHCLRCATVCGEMKAVTARGNLQLLGPGEHFCTACGLCQMRCSYLATIPKEGSSRSADPRLRLHEGGAALHLYGDTAFRFRDLLRRTVSSGDSIDFPYRVSRLWEIPPDGEIPPEIPLQFKIEARDPEGGLPGQALLATFPGDGSGGETAVVRSCRTAGLVLQTEEGDVERDIAGQALALGLEVKLILDCERTGISVPRNPLTEWFHRLGQPALVGKSLLQAWESGEVDFFLAPYADEVSPELQRRILEQTGRTAHILAPNLLQALPFSKSPLLWQLNRSLWKVYLRHPELLAKEARYASELLENLPANSAVLHARYRPLAFASGHSACPSCAEAMVLSIPVYMAIAMSLARGEIPRVSFTCETGCMSETLNKVGEVSQKVPGGRTVFGGGFAFGEAIAMVQDHAVRRGVLPKGRRYVISQGGDGGAVIGLPAWLNALRQQARLIRQRHPNVLHFINITDTQVYSNTGGESSASSLLGMGTLTTPIGRFLLGNQRTQWSLINLAAEFPGILVGAGHSANKLGLQQFWHLADQLGESAIHWDISPCPETGKFYGEDPDDLAELMSHAGMIPEILFVGRFRKRVAPYHPEDRNKPYREWRLQPKPVLYWLRRDPRYRMLFKTNPETGEMEVRNLTCHYLVTQIESYRDQVNRQIDLESRIVRRAEERVSEFFQELRESWEHYRFRLGEFPYAMLFNDRGERKPEYGIGLEYEMVRRILGWEEATGVLDRRDRLLNHQRSRLEELVSELESLDGGSVAQIVESDPLARRHGAVKDLLIQIQKTEEILQEQARGLRAAVNGTLARDPVEDEIFGPPPDSVEALARDRMRDLYGLLDRIIEERAVARQVELQQHRLARTLTRKFEEEGGVFGRPRAPAHAENGRELLDHIRRFGPFSVGVASLAGDRGIAVNRVFAGFFSAKGAWAGMAWQFGSSKRGTPVLSATFVDARPFQRKDAMQSVPVAVLAVTNFEELKRSPDLLFGGMRPGGYLIINHRKSARALWHELVAFFPEEVRTWVAGAVEASSGKPISSPTFPGGNREEHGPPGLPGSGTTWTDLSEPLFGKPFSLLTPGQKEWTRKVAAISTVRILSLDMDGIIQEVTGSRKIVSNLVAVAPLFHALQEQGFPFRWEEDRDLLVRGFPEAVLKNPQLLAQYERGMELARERWNSWTPVPASPAPPSPAERRDPSSLVSAKAEEVPREESPSDCLMIMGGTLAGMVLSQVALEEHPLFYIGFPITPAGNPFYAMAEAYADGHPYIVVDEVNPSEKVAAEKLLGIARTGGFLPVTFTASQGWRLFTEILPQFVGARLEGLFIITRRALAAPNLNIEESHTDFLSFRDDGGIMLSPKGMEEYVPTLYLARILTHFAKLPVILSIGGITDTHKIGLFKVPPDEEVRTWLRKTLADFDFLEDKLLNPQEHLIVHGPSGTSSVYQETQSEIEKAHRAVQRIFPYALRAVSRLTGTALSEIEVAGTDPSPQRTETLLILQGSLFPNAEAALLDLEREGWRGLACISVRCFNPFPEEELLPWLSGARRIAVMDRSNSFGSLPPLASRVFSAVARHLSRPWADHPRQLRSLVGGLGGRMITVAQMREILLSTHLLFHPPREWETGLVREWIASDETLRALLEEAAALDLRNTDRHSRVPESLRPASARRREYEERLAALSRQLLEKDYRSLLANYHQVEFIEPREVLLETTLLQQIVQYVETRLARHALDNGLASPRHAQLLNAYSTSEEDLERARVYLEGAAEAREGFPGAVSVSGDSEIHSSPPAEELKETEPGDPIPDPRSDRSGPLPAGEPDEPADFAPDPREAELIEVHLTSLAALQGELPLYYNPEDFEHEVLRLLQKDPGSCLFELSRKVPADRLPRLLRRYRSCYADVIDRVLQREVLSMHHAPELRGLFEGEGKRRLEALALRILPYGEGMDPERLERWLTGELERYLAEVLLPGCPKAPIFYLEYFRQWIAPDLVKTALDPLHAARTKEDFQA